MPGLISPRTKFSPIERLKIADRTQMYAYVGQTLNQRYLTNRQAALQSVYNPLSQMKVRDEDRALFTDIQDRITSGLNKFKENNDWSQATSAVFDATQSLASNNGLKAMQQEYLKEQEYMKSVDESEWDSTVKTRLKLESKYNSSAIVYDEHNNIVEGGGFKGTSFGKPYDEAGYMVKVADLMTKIPASGSEIQKVLTDPNSNIVRGISSFTGEDGETVVAQFTQVLNSSEGVSRDKVIQAAKNMLMSNKELIAHKKFVTESQLFMSRVVKDETSEKGFRLRNMTPQDLAFLYQGNEVPIAYAGLGLNMNEIFTQDKKGNYKLQKNIAPSDKAVIDALLVSTGVDITKVLTDKKYVDSLSDEQRVALSQIMQKGYNNYVEDDYRRNSGGQDFNTWASNKYVDTSVQADLLASIQMFGDTYSWQKTSSKETLVNNHAYAGKWKAYQEKKKELEEQAQALVLSGGSVSGAINIGNIASSMQDADKISEAIVSARNNLKDIDITGVTGKLDLKQEDLSDYNKLMELANNSKDLSDEEKGRLMEYATLSAGIALNQAKLEDIRNVFDQAQEIWRKDPEKAKGSGYYGVEDSRAKDIMEYGLDTYDKWKRHADALIKQANANNNSIFGSPVIKGMYATAWDLSEEEFKKIRDNATHNVISRYNKNNPSQSVEIITPGIIYGNTNATTRQLSDAAKYEIIHGDNTGWSIMYTPNGNGVGTSANTLRSLLSANSFNPASQGGETVRGKAEGVDASAFGIEEPVYSTKLMLGDTNVKEAGANNMLGVIECIGLNGNVVGRITVKRKADKQELLNLSTNAINVNNNILKNTDPNDPVADLARENANRAARSAAYHTLSFDIEGRQGLSQIDIERELETQEMNYKPGPQSNGMVYVTTATHIRNPYSNDELGAVPVRIGKAVGQDAYTFEILSTDPTTGQASLNNVPGAIPNYNFNVPMANGSSFQISVPELAPGYVYEGGVPRTFNSISEASGRLSYRIITGLNEVIRLNNDAINRQNRTIVK